jgi:hypothetical protein
MDLERRRFLKTAGFGLGAMSMGGFAAAGDEPARKSASFAKAARMKLGTVTYNLAKDWDVPAIIKHCREARGA